MLATDCPMPMGECQVRTCVAGVCSTAPVAMGTPTSMQTAGDCQTAVCDGMGGVTAVNDDTDIADDGNECTYDTCSAGTPSSVFAPAGDLCTGGLCDGAGTCVGCLSDAECPAPMNECQVAVCDLGVCGTDPVLAGTPTSMQTQGDCHLNACSGGGTILSFIDDTDVPSDGNMCTVDACVMGMPVFGPQPYGTPCMENGGAICDGMGTCIPPP